mmetsp:Transcript_52446/g.60262  ORF Transcript_52446/g.60262 Transcript_52446/m.60262 type:complete len:221 (+) Transcript_52446:28-690(+)
MRRSLGLCLVSLALPVGFRSPRNSFGFCLRSLCFSFSFFCAHRTCGPHAYASSGAQGISKSPVTWSWPTTKDRGLMWSPERLDCPPAGSACFVTREPATRTTAPAATRSFVSDRSTAVSPSRTSIVPDGSSSPFTARSPLNSTSRAPVTYLPAIDTVPDEPRVTRCRTAPSRTALTSVAPAATVRRPCSVIGARTETEPLPSRLSTRVLRSRTSGVRLTR